MFTHLREGKVIGEETIDFTNSEYKLSMEFKADGTVIESFSKSGVAQDDKHTTYEIKDNNISIDGEDGPTVGTYAISNGKIKLDYEEYDGDVEERTVAEGKRIK